MLIAVIVSIFVLFFGNHAEAQIVTAAEIASEMNKKSLCKYLPVNIEQAKEASEKAYKCSLEQSENGYSSLECEQPKYVLIIIQKWVDSNDCRLSNEQRVILRNMQFMVEQL